MGLSHPYFDAKSQCCSRLVNYNCMKESLTFKYGFSKEKYDDINVNYWNTEAVTNVVALYFFLKL